MHRKVKLLRAVTVAPSVGFFVGMIPQLKAEGYEVVSVSSTGPALDKVWAAGARAEVVEMQRHISPLRDLKSLIQMWWLMRRERPDIVHSMTPKAGLVCMMAAWLARVPVRIHTFTGLVFPTSTGLKRRILMATDRLTCACATHVIPEGEGVRTDLVSNGITRKPIRVLGYGNCRGIDLERFNPDLDEVTGAAAKLRSPGVFTFLYIGRLVGDKGINELVSAFERLRAEKPNIRLVLVGGQEAHLDPLKPSTLRTIEQSPAIETPGHLADVRPWLAAADCFILPSYREGFPNVVIEAGAMGLPSIVTDINGSREIILDGENGIIIPPRDADALYRAMTRMLADGPARTTMAANARALIASRYDQTYVRQCLLDFYRETLSAP